MHNADPGKSRSFDFSVSGDLSGEVGSLANAKGVSKKGSSSVRDFTARSGQNARNESNMELLVSGRSGPGLGRGCLGFLGDVETEICGYFDCG